MFKEISRTLRIVILPVLLLVLLALHCGCAWGATLAAPPNLPPNYYACIETTPEELLKSYSANYGDISRAQAIYTGQPFVFKKIRIDPLMLVDPDTFVCGTIKFTAMEPGAVAKLKVGETIDIVGVNTGMPLEYPGWLFFTGCVFLPAGSIDIPTPGGAVFVPMY